MTRRAKIISRKSTTVTYETVKVAYDKFTITESYTDDKLVGQAWSVKGGFKTTHPSAYEPKRMHFDYYEDIGFLNSEKNSDCGGEFYKDVPAPTFVDWDNFKGLSHVLCDHLGMDGNIYRVDKPNPLKLWRHQDYIGGFCNRDYDLNQVVVALKRRTWIRNIEIVDIPYYNRDEGRTKAVEFDYKLPAKKHLGKRLGKEALFKSHYFG